jgi:hypothetical protein
VKVKAKGVGLFSVGPQTGVAAKLFGWAVSYLLPDKPDVGVFMRLMLISMLIFQAFITASLSFVRGEIPYLGPLVPSSVSSMLTSYGYAFLYVVVDMATYF